MAPSSSLPLAVYGEVITADEVAALLRMTPAWVYAETRCNAAPISMRRASAEADPGQRGTRTGESVVWGPLNGGPTRS